MRLLVAGVAGVILTVQLSAQPQAPPGLLYRGPLVSEKEATLILPDRGVPLEFGPARLVPGGPAPWARYARARIQVNLTSKTLRPVRLDGITLRVAVGPSEHGMLTFLMRAESGFPPDLNQLAHNGQFRTAFFVSPSGRALPTLLLLHPETRVVFTVERVESVDGHAVFENPDATELLWEALGRPSFNSQ